MKTDSFLICLAFIFICFVIWSIFDPKEIAENPKPVFGETLTLEFNEEVTSEDLISVKDITLDITEYQYLTIPCQDGEVVLNFKTGEVEYVNCSPPESGLAFWKSVVDSYDDIKANILYRASEERKEMIKEQ